MHLALICSASSSACSHPFPAALDLTLDLLTGSQDLLLSKASAYGHSAAKNSEKHPSILLAWSQLNVAS